MSEFIFFCTNCGTKLMAAPEDAGSECECPECSRVQVIPGEKDVEDAPIAPISRSANNKKRITISGPIESTFTRDPYSTAVDDSGVGRIFRFLAAVLGLAGLGAMALAFFWVMKPTDQHPAWLDRAVQVGPLVLAGFIAIIVARVAFIVGSLGIRYERG